jgi:hypothetical protein
MTRFDKKLTKYSLGYAILMWLFYAFTGDHVFWIWKLEKALGLISWLLVYLSYGVLIIGTFCIIGFLIQIFQKGFEKAWNDEFGDEDEHNI